MGYFGWVAHYLEWVGLSGGVWIIILDEWVWVGHYFEWFGLGEKQFWVGRGGWGCMCVSGGGWGVSALFDNAHSNMQNPMVVFNFPKKLICFFDVT